VPAERRRRRAAAVALALVLLVLAAPAAASAADLPVPRHRAAEVKRTTRDVLDRREFRRPPPNLYQRARGWVADQLTKILNTLVGGGGAAYVAWGVIIAAIALVVVLALRAGRTVQAEHRRRVVPILDRRTTADEWRALAAGAEAAGQWRDALRSRYRALVGDLVARRVLRDVAGRTTGEYSADAREGLAPDAAAAFVEATRLFELAWYGDRATGPDENRRFRTLADRVVTAADRQPEREPVAS
jgi:hypothetical protein